LRGKGEDTSGGNGGWGGKGSQVKTFQYIADAEGRFGRFGGGNRGWFGAIRGGKGRGMACDWISKKGGGGGGRRGAEGSWGGGGGFWWGGLACVGKVEGKGVVGGCLFMEEKSGANIFSLSL